MASALAKKLKEVVMTSSPGRTPRARRPMMSASVPEFRVNGVSDAEVARDLSLEGLYLRAEDELARTHDPVDGGLELGLELLDLRAEVEQGDVLTFRHRTG